MIKIRRLIIRIFVAAILFACTPLLAQDNGLVDAWQQRALETQAEQPHWITPLITVTPRLEQELRYDLSWRESPDGTTTANYGGGKGLELIPTRSSELIVGIPPYVTHGNAAHNGFGDLSFLLKYRLLAANESNGNYVVTLFLGASVPTGSYSNGNKDAVMTPTLAAGKGWGNFDVESTVGVGLATAGSAQFGHPVVFNTAAQYRILKKLWPELEANATFWPDGTLSGHKQVFLTPGLILGRFPIRNRLGITAGAGVQIAATHFHQFNHNWVLSLRMPF